MTKADFIRTCDVLRCNAFTVDASSYDKESFGSWWVSVAHQPRLRIVWDGKEGWVDIQRETDRQFQGLSVWQDIWIGQDFEKQKPDFVVNKLRELTGGG